MSEDNNIPKHWGRTKASEVGKLLRGINYKKQDASNEARKDFLPVLRGNNINGELNFEDLVFVPKQNVSSEQLIKAGDIVFAMSSGSKHLVGKSAKAKTDYNGSFGAFCGVFRPNENFDKNFVAYFFQSPYYKKVISEISKGTNINNLKREHILDLDFPIPPFPEQQAIVAKIEELLSDLENGKQQLQTAQQQLKVYRQSLLKWAFEGKLTNKNVKEGDLPEEWKWMKLGDVSDMCLGKMLDKKNNKGNYQPYLRNISVRWGQFDLTDLEEMRFEPQEEERYGLKIGDIVVCEGGEPGRCAIWKGDIPNMKIQKALHRVRVKPGLQEKYLYYFIYYSAKSGLLKKHYTGTTIKHLTGRELKKIVVAMPSINEQQLIVNELESKLTVCDKMEETIGQSLQQAEILRQSILKKAFEGKLINCELKITS